MWTELERWTRRRLSAYPRLRGLALAVRRRLARVRGPALASRHWDRRVSEVEAGAGQGWLDWPIVEEEYVRPQVSGDSRVGYRQYFVDRYLSTPAERILSLGCGGGNLERLLIGDGAAEQVDGFDVSPDSIRLAEQLAASAGMAERIRYAVADLDTLELRPASYDAVVAKMALHHLEDLEHVYSQVRCSLKPGGVFMFNEFVGPSRFQWTDLQLELMNELLRALPERQHKAAPFTRIVRPKLADMKILDPSEAVRSAEILPLLERHFEVVEYKPYGGTLLHILLSHVMPAFDLEDERDLSILRLLFLYEKTLVRQRALPSDFAFVVARPLGAARRDGTSPGRRP